MGLKPVLTGPVVSALPSMVVAALHVWWAQIQWSRRLSMVLLVMATVAASVITSVETSACSIMAMEAVYELTVPHATATDAIQELSVLNVTATEAVHILFCSAVAS